jgi:arsenical resistance protein ArsH
LGAESEYLILQHCLYRMTRAKAYEQFDDMGRMRPSPYYDRIVDVMEELVKFTLLTRGLSSNLTDRYSERKEEVEKAVALRQQLGAM